MTDSTTLLLKLISEGNTINEISEKMNMSHKQIYNIIALIRNKGFEFDRKYYYNGDIIYVPKRSFIEVQHKGVDIITSPNDQKFEALVISDLHIGNVKERLDLLNKAYDYCVKEGINIIIGCGDIIDGMCDRSHAIHDNVYDQIDYAIKNYPFDKNILNFMVLGNHDYNALKMYGQNLAKVFESYRHDIISLGYCIGQINIKNDKIIVRHPSDQFDELKLQPMNKCLMLNGHSHKTKYIANTSTPTICIPSLSDLSKNGNIATSAIRMSLELKNGMLCYGHFSQLLFGENVYTISEFECPLSYGKDFSGNSPVKLEEDRPKKKILELTEIKRPMSQIEKFNARWNK